MSTRDRGRRDEKLLHGAGAGAGAGERAGPLGQE